MIKFSQFLTELSQELKNHYIYIVAYRTPGSTNFNYYIGISYTDSATSPKLAKDFWAGLRWDGKQHTFLNGTSTPTKLWNDSLFKVTNFIDNVKKGKIQGVKYDPKNSDEFYGKLYKEADPVQIAPSQGKLYMSSSVNRNKGSLPSAITFGITENGKEGKLHPLHPRILNYSTAKSIIDLFREKKAKKRDKFNFLALNNLEFPNSKESPAGENADSYAYLVFVADELDLFYQELEKFKNTAQNIKFDPEVLKQILNIGNQEEFQKTIKEVVTRYASKLWVNVGEFNKDEKLDGESDKDFSRRRELIRELDPEVKKMSVDQFVNKVIQSFDKDKENKNAYFSFIEHVVSTLKVDRVQNVSTQNFYPKAHIYNDVYIPQEFKTKNPEYRELLVQHCSNKKMAERLEPIQDFYDRKDYEKFDLFKFLYKETGDKKKPYEMRHSVNHTKYNALLLFDASTTTDITDKTGREAKIAGKNTSETEGKTKKSSIYQEELINFYKYKPGKGGDRMRNIIREKLEKHFFEVEFPNAYNFSTTRDFNKRFILQTSNKNGKTENFLLVKRDSPPGGETPSHLKSVKFVEPTNKIIGSSKNTDRVKLYVKPLIKMEGNSSSKDILLGRNNYYYKDTDGELKIIDDNVRKAELPSTRSGKTIGRYKDNDKERKTPFKIYDKEGQLVGTRYGFETPYSMFNFLTEVLGFNFTQTSLAPPEFADTFLEEDRKIPNVFDMDEHDDHHFVFHKRKSVSEEYISEARPLPDPRALQSARSRISGGQVKNLDALRTSKPTKTKTLPDKSPEEKQRESEEAKENLRSKGLSISNSKRNKYNILELFSIEENKFVQALKNYGKRPNTKFNILALETLYKLLNGKIKTGSVFFFDGRKDKSITSIQELKKCFDIEV